jgi:hypothetical protein
VSEDSPHRIVKRKLEEILHSQTGPYLFVGAGISRRYAGLPDWSGLLREFAKYANRPYDYYVARSESDLAVAAGIIADDFFDVWWNDPRFQGSVSCYQESIKDKSTPLKIEIAKYISDKTNNLPNQPELREEFEAFRKVNIDAIITTNYDDLLSQIFPEFRVFIGQDELLFANPQGLAEIYQIHGAVRSPSSLILTDKDYTDFNERNSYLAAKLITVFMEHPVIFLGYSLSDPNVTQILESIIHGIRPESVDRLRSRLIFVEWKPGESASIVDTVATFGGVSLPITRVTADSFTWIYEALSNRARALPARTLRLLKEQVFNLIQTNDPQGQLVQVADLDRSTSADDLDIVFGVGARIQSKGIVGLSRWDLVDDVLNSPNLGLVPHEVLQRVVPRMTLPTYVPIFKYLRASGNLEKLQNNEEVSLPKKVIERYSDYSKRFEKYNIQRNKSESMSVLVGEKGIEYILDHALELPKFTTDEKGLRDILLRERERRNQPRWSTSYAKLAVVYDWMHFMNEGTSRKS